MYATSSFRQDDVRDRSGGGARSADPEINRPGRDAFAKKSDVCFELQSCFLAVSRTALSSAARFSRSSTCSAGRRRETILSNCQDPLTGTVIEDQVGKIGRSPDQTELHHTLLSCPPPTNATLCIPRVVSDNANESYGTDGLCQVRAQSSWPLCVYARLDQVSSDIWLLLVPRLELEVLGVSHVLSQQ
jgi:hypothetical protein